MLVGVKDGQGRPSGLWGLAYPHSPICAQTHLYADNHGLYLPVESPPEYWEGSYSELKCVPVEMFVN